MQYGWPSSLGLGESVRYQAGEIRRGYICQALRASLGKGQWGATEEEKEYDLCFRKATMAAMGKEFVRGTAWRLAGRPGRRLMQ